MFFQGLSAPPIAWVLGCLTAYLSSMFWNSFLKWIREWSVLSWMWGSHGHSGELLLHPHFVTMWLQLCVGGLMLASAGLSASCLSVSLVYLQLLKFCEKTSSSPMGSSTEHLVSCIWSIGHVKMAVGLWVHTSVGPWYPWVLFYRNHGGKGT